jgi:hypothetical protein
MIYSKPKKLTWWTLGAIARRRCREEEDLGLVFPANCISHPLENHLLFHQCRAPHF